MVSQGPLPGWPIIGCNPTKRSALNNTSVCRMADVFVQYRRLRPLLTNPKATLTELPEVLVAHQHEHLRQTVCYIAALARRGLSDAGNPWLTGADVGATVSSPAASSRSLSTFCVKFLSARPSPGQSPFTLNESVANVK